MPPVHHRPLRPVVDGAIFLDRRRLREDLREAVDSGENVLLVGEPGSGKTTLLNWLIADLDAAGQAVAHVQASLARDVHELLALVEAELPSDTALQAPATGLPISRAAIGGEFPEGAASRWDGVRLGREIKRLERSARVVIIIDGLTGSAIGADLFARGRDALWAVGHQWVVAAQPEQEAVLARPPAGAFWSDRVHVPGLSADEAERLLRLRGVDSSGVPDFSGFALAGLGPREILVAATRPRAFPESAVASGEPPLEVEPSLKRLIDALVALDRPVAADDDDLLRRVGWSRAYTQRLLRDLSSHGQIETTVERRDTPGRPRMLYRARTVEGHP